MSRSVDDEMDVIEQILNTEIGFNDETNECDFCGCRISFGHAPNHDKLTMEEIVQCHSCGNLERRKVHNIN